MATKSFQYDHPHYTTVRQSSTTFDVTSAVESAFFRSRLNILVHTIDIIVDSAASQASDIVTILHNGSVAGTITFDSANSIGVKVCKTISRTLASIGDRLGLMHDHGAGQYTVVYTYQVLPMSDVTVA